MKAMVLSNCDLLVNNPQPLTLEDVPTPKLKHGECLIKVAACGVCHTELDEIEGRMEPARLPMIPGHQVVGTIVEVAHQNNQSDNSNDPKSNIPIHVGDRVGVAWINWACGECEYCKSGNENLCQRFTATGRDVNGGYAQFISAPTGFVHPIPIGLSDAQAAPLLCAGAIGCRSLTLSGVQNGDTLGLTGFGASGHLTLKIAKAKFPDLQFFVFSRNANERNFALSLGANWAGNFEDDPPALLDAIIDTTPAWKPVLYSLAKLKPGGRLVINAIRKEENDKGELEKMDYPNHLWKEKEIKSVANVTRRDVQECLKFAAEAGIHSEIQTYPLEDANRALLEMKKGSIRGAKVLQIDH
jgi:propanol-preferring alcohol dehydrogenase